MKTRKYNLNAIAMGVALVLGSMSAANAAVPVNPSSAGLLDAIAQEKLGPNVPLTGDVYDIADRGAICLVESALSLVASKEHFSPGCTAKSYALNVESNYFGDGFAALDDKNANGVVNLTNKVSENGNSPSRGAKCDVRATGSLFGTTLTDYVGQHAWARYNQFFIDGADFRLNGVPYDEHSIKDFYGRALDLQTGEQYAGGPWIFDWGLEVVTKLGYPVSKWSEQSWYHKWDGVDGKVKVIKQDVGTNCTITYVARPYQQGDGITINGFVKVSRGQ